LIVELPAQTVNQQLITELTPVAPTPYIPDLAPQ
jgi:hypothetical protein